MQGCLFGHTSATHTHADTEPQHHLFHVLGTKDIEYFECVEWDQAIP